MAGVEDTLLRKAVSALAGAESEFSARRYDNVANRCYYACYQTAVAALEAAGFRATGGKDQWSHAAVHAQFVGQLINRRKRYPSSLQSVHPALFTVRQQADYSRVLVSAGQARRALHRARQFVDTVRSTFPEESR